MKKIVNVVKQAVVVIGNSIASDWKKMKIFRKISLLIMLGAAFCNILAAIFMKQVHFIVWELSFFMVFACLVFMVGGIFVGIAKEVVEDFPGEWKKMDKAEKIIFSTFLLTAIMFIPALILGWRNVMLLLPVTGFCWLIDQLIRIISQRIETRTIEPIKAKLLQLEVELELIAMAENKIEAVVKLFKIISPIQDEGAFSREISKLKKIDRKGKKGSMIAALEVIQKHCKNAGRCEGGMNRTMFGEEVNAEKVYLGDIFGIWTKSAAYWLEKKEELKKNLCPDASKDPKKPLSTWYLINDYQCGSFIKSHANGILEQITIFKAVV